MEDGPSTISIGIFDVTEQVQQKMLDEMLRKRRQTIWMDQVKDSEFFVVLATPQFFSHVMSTVQTEFAKTHNKPFRVLLQEGTEIPKGFFDGVKDIKFETFSHLKNIGNAFTRLMGKKFMDKCEKEGLNLLGEGF